MECSKGVEGVHERHCLHDHAETGSARGEGRICCWCGDLFVRDGETAKHGKHLPRAVLTHAKVRELARVLAHGLAKAGYLYQADIPKVENLIKSASLLRRWR